jgi:hypothetical protein
VFSSQLKLSCHTFSRNKEGNIDENEADTYYIDFVFDADVKCFITVHYLAFEDLSSGHAV